MTASDAVPQLNSLTLQSELITSAFLRSSVVFFGSFFDPGTCSKFSRVPTKLIAMSPYHFACLNLSTSVSPKYSAMVKAMPNRYSTSGLILITSWMVVSEPEAVGLVSTTTLVGGGTGVSGLAFRMVSVGVAGGSLRAGDFLRSGFALSVGGVISSCLGFFLEADPMAGGAISSCFGRFL